MSSQGRRLDSPQAISALAGVRPPDLETLRGDPALEEKYPLSWEIVTHTTGISSQIRTKLRDWPVWQAGAGCYSQAALSSNDSKTLQS